MPIRPEWRPLYRGPAWKAIRARILERAGHRCERCGKPNHRRVWVYHSPLCGQYWTPGRIVQSWTWCGHGPVNFALFGSAWRTARRIRVVLTIAHLNHDPRDNRDSNLAALCQYCHLAHDKEHHRETRRRRKDQRRPLLAGVEL